MSPSPRVRSFGPTKPKGTRCETNSPSATTAAATRAAAWLPKTPELRDADEVRRFVGLLLDQLLNPSPFRDLELEAYVVDVPIYERAAKLVSVAA